MKKRDAVQIATQAIPTGWLDPLLTGPNAVLGQPPYNCHDVERLLNAIRARIAVRFETSPPNGPAEPK
jgi:hypothetical protein